MKQMLKKDLLAEVDLLNISLHKEEDKVSAARRKTTEAQEHITRLKNVCHELESSMNLIQGELNRVNRYEEREDEQQRFMHTLPERRRRDDVTRLSGSGKTYNEESFARERNYNMDKEETPQPWWASV